MNHEQENKENNEKSTVHEQANATAEQANGNGNGEGTE